MHFELDYAVLPGPVVNAWLGGQIKTLELKIYLVVQNYSRSREGCYIHNDTFAGWFGTHATHISSAISILKQLGFIEQTKFDGRRRHLRTVGVEGGRVEPALAKTAKAALAKTANQRSSKLKATLSGVATTPDGEGNSNGFGIATPTKPPTEFDEAAAKTLLDIITTYAKRTPRGPGITNINRAKPSTWPEHIRLLRTVDEVKEGRIRRVLKWYAENIGEPFCPQAFSGIAFRQKFHKLERAAERDIDTTVEIGAIAAKVAERLAGLGWPRGTVATLPAATQACLNGYQAGLAKMRAFVRRLRADDLTEEYRDRTKMLGVGEAVLERLPTPEAFIEGWMRDVHTRVRGWEKWDGDLAPYVFSEGSKRFHGMCRGFAERHCGDPDRWDRFYSVMVAEMRGSEDEPA